MAKNEKSADIIAELRELSKSVKRCECEHLTTVYGLNLYLAEFADRLEAAIKREKAAIEADALAAGGIVEAERYKPGNAAAMREALERLREWAALDLNENAYIDQESGNHLKLINGILEIANAALAAPPRNCDRFATVKDAAIAFARERQDAPHPCPDFTFSAWLFEPAMEKEGGAKWNAFAKRVAPKEETKGAEGK